jgi:CheY-like chemotaxis protein
VNATPFDHPAGVTSQSYGVIKGDKMHPDSPLIRPRRIAKKTILVADDNARIRETLAKVFGEFLETVTVVLVKDGAEAVEHALAHNPDLAVLDLAMPVMHGLEAARRLKVLKPELPIIIFSVHAETLRMKPEVLGEWGITAVIDKFAPTTKLVKTVRELLSLQPTDVSKQRSDAA